MAMWPSKYILASLSHHSNHHHVRPCQTYTYVAFRTNSQSLVRGGSRPDGRDPPLSHPTLNFAKFSSRTSDQGVYQLFVRVLLRLPVLETYIHIPRLHIQLAEL